MKKEDYFIRKMEDSGNEQNSFSLIADIEGTDEADVELKIQSGDVVPVLPLRNMLLFPSVYMPVAVGRRSSLKLIKECEKKQKNIAVVCQKDSSTEEPDFDDLHSTGTIATIVRILEMPDQTTTVILRGVKRCKLLDIESSEPYLQGKVDVLTDKLPDKNDREFQALAESCKDLTVRYIRASDMLHQDSIFAIRNLNNYQFLIGFICSNLPLKKEDKLELLEIGSLKARAYKLLEILNREVQLAEIKASIQRRAKEDIDQQQREYFLQQQIKTIQDELGGGGQEQEIEEMRQKAYK